MCFFILCGETGIRTPPCSAIPPNRPMSAKGIHCNLCLSFAHSSELGLANLVKVCGETGIRTPETLLEFTRFPGVPLQPLEHLSFALSGAKLNIGYKITTFFAHTQEFVQIFTYFLLFYAEKLSCISTCSLNYLIHGHI